MCGRYTLTTIDDLSDRYALASRLEGVAPSYNVAPGQSMPVVVDANGQNELKLMKWGLVPSWAKEAKVGYKMINARSEGIETKPSFRHAYKSQRCLVPANGFYEWQKSTTGKTPYYITLANQDILSFAGLWEYWQQPDGQSLETYTIITTQANSDMEYVHDRMPVIVKPQQEDDWLNPNNQDPEFLRQLIQSSRDASFVFTPVSDEVNKVANNYPELIRPLHTKPL